MPPPNDPTGRWALRMQTPIGTIEADMSFAQHGATFAGRATARGETVPMREVEVLAHPDGQRVTWKQTITRPMRLQLVFDVVITGDEMHGHSRAGRLPKSTVTGHRTPS